MNNISRVTILFSSPCRNLFGCKQLKRSVVQTLYVYHIYKYANDTIRSRKQSKSVQGITLINNCHLYVES